MKQKEKNQKPILYASLFAILVAFILVVLKTTIYILSGSTAVLATLVDSIVDFFVSLMLFYALRYSFRPADEDHRHGHGKMEALASLFQGTLVIAAGIYVIFESLERFAAPQEITHHILAIGILLVSIALSFVVLMVQGRVLQKNQSLILEADFSHYKTDLFLNASVIFSLIMNVMHGPLWLDPLIALLISGYFFFTAYRITKNSINVLMDRELSDDIRQHIEGLVKNHHGVLGFHDLRTRHCGMYYHINIDVELDKSLKLEEAHDIVRALDQKIMDHYPNAEVMIHMDPEGDTDDARHKLKDGHFANDAS